MIFFSFHHFSFKGFEINIDNYCQSRNIEIHDKKKCIGGVIDSMLASSVVDLVFNPRSGQTIDYEIGISCFSAKHA
jgi:hypothetical protein